MIRPRMNQKASASFIRINDKGFTLLEGMLALFVSSLSVLLLGLLIQFFIQVPDHLIHQKHSEWYVFLHQFTDEIDGYYLAQLGQGHVLFEREGDIEGQKSTLFFIKYGDRLVVQKGFTGHQPLLTGLDQINYYKLEDNLLEVQAHFLTGEKYSAKVATESPPLKEPAPPIDTSDEEEQENEKSEDSE